jgi:hypothetical protein
VVEVGARVHRFPRFSDLVVNRRHFDLGTAKLAVHDKCVTAGGRKVQLTP